MVFFTCNNCGTTIKKNQVAAHKFKCRNANVSCIDCGKDFWGTEYEAHIKCISEEEKYSGKNFVPKASSNKGQKRQDDWLDCLNQLLKTGNLKKHIRLVVEKLVKLPNVPQKKAKFENFLKNVGIKSPAIIAEAWGVISKVLEEMKAKKSALSKSLGDVSAVKEKNVENSENSNEQVIKTEIMENETKSEKETTKEKSKKRKRQKKSTSEEDLETSKNLENIDVKGNEEENKIKKKKKNSKNNVDSNTEHVENEKGNEVDTKAENDAKKKKANSQNGGDSKSEILENETKSEMQPGKGKSRKRKRQRKGISEKGSENSKNLENIEIKGNEIDNGTENGIKKKKKNSRNNSSKSEEILSPAKENIKHEAGKENGPKKRKKNSQKNEDSKSEEIESPANKKIKHGQSKLNQVK